MVKLNTTDNFLFATILALTAIGPITTKAGGLAWILLIILAIKAIIVNNNVAKTPNETLDAAKIWMWFCVAGCTLIVFAVIYWDDPLSRRHFDLRTLISSLAIISLIKFLPNLNRIRIWLIFSILISGIAFLIMIYLMLEQGIATPTNRINWAVGFALINCILLGLLFLDGMTKLELLMIYSGIIIYLSAIFFSGVRGSYFIYIWTTLVIVYFLKVNFKNGKQYRILITSLSITLITAISLVTYFGSSSKTSVINRLQVAKNEIHFKFSANELERTSKTSLGARLSMWQHAIEIIPQNPILGVGFEQSRVEMKILGHKYNTFTHLRHFHNEYINALVRYGIFGLTSFLMYSLGLFIISIRVFKSNRAASIGLMGICLNHSIASITNVNSGHNNYGVYFNICLIMIFLFLFNANKTDSSTNRNTF